MTVHEGKAMTDQAKENEISGGTGLIGFVIIVGVMVLFWPALMGLFNTVMYPGYETCKREIDKILRDPNGADFEWPPRRFSHRSDPDIWRYAIDVNAGNAYGGRSSKQIACTVDASGSEKSYSVEW